eukprot:2195438-Rhodomonas_salina.10
MLLHSAVSHSSGHESGPSSVSMCVTLSRECGALRVQNCGSIQRIRLLDNNVPLGGGHPPPMLRMLVFKGCARRVGYQCPD